MKQYPVTIPYFSHTEIEEIEKVIETGWVAQGPKVAEFEKQIAAHEGVREGVATTSCTTALQLALKAEGVGEGMDVIAPSFTFVATVNSIVAAGATPVLVDVLRETFCIAPEAVRRVIEERYFENADGQWINRYSGQALWGIVPVHQFGLCCDIRAINAIATQYHLKVVEDAACAFAAQIDGVCEGAFGNTACLSFHPRKSITTGEGGMVLTDDPALAARMRRLRSHGSGVSADKRHVGHGFLLPPFEEMGYNYRMTDMQAAMGIAQLRKIDAILEAKTHKANLYKQLLEAEIPGFVPPAEPAGYRHTYQSYVCMLDYEQFGLHGIEEGGDFRDDLLAALEDRGVSTRQGTHAVHTLHCYVNAYGYRPMDLPEAYACDRLSISLPLYVQMTDEDQLDIVHIIRDTLREMRK